MKSRHYIVPIDKERQILDENPGFDVAFKRYFMSSASVISEEPGAVSHIGQKPLLTDSDMVWLWLVDKAVERHDHISVVREDGLTHLWTADLFCGNGYISKCDGSGPQTGLILKNYDDILSEYGGNVEANTHRTWFFVRDIDNNYADFVLARKEFFKEHGLVEHSIASTGIEGNPIDENAIVSMDAYAVVGLENNRIQYLEALDYMNSPHDYGVTFERGVKLDFTSNQETMISGTASIDNKGEIMYIGDVSSQTARAIDNIEALLKSTGQDILDVKMALIYVREDDFAEDALEAFRTRFPESVPYVVLHAPVCRPGWLVEIECIV